MQITLTNEQAEFVNEQVKSGAYPCPEAVIRAALLLLKAREERLDVLRKEIQRGIDDIEQGRFISIDSDEELDQFFEEIISGRAHSYRRTHDRHD